MKYNELNITANRNKKRVGRGISAGGGKTAGHGTKGQGARTGKKLNAMFQGGQRALVQAIPKARGFKSLRTPAQVVYIDHLAVFKGKTVDNMALFTAGLIASPFHSVRLKAQAKTQLRLSKKPVEVLKKHLRRLRRLKKNLKNKLFLWLTS